MAKLESELPAKSARVAAFISGFDLRNAPAQVIDVAETAFIDTIGVMLAGSYEPAAKIVCDMIAAEGAGPVASIVGRGLRTSAQNAALANGTATQALDFDLSFMSGQSAAAVIPALLPLAETVNASARDLISAFIVGGEIAARVVRSFPTLSSEGGWHGAGIVGAIAAAAACAKLTNAPAESIPAILGIGASMASGLGENFGTMTKPLHPGMAARNGMMAAYLGAKGFTASDTAVEGPQGFLALYARGLDWDAAPFDDLGEEFNLLDPGYKIKPFSCGGLLHTAIEAALHLREAVQPRLNQIDKIVIGATPHAVRRVIDQYPWSEDSARFSLKFLIPHALIHGAPTLATFSEKALEDDAVRALSERVTGIADDEFSGGNGIGYSPSRVTITFKNGNRLEETVIHPSGSKASPMSDATIKAKFHDCATRAVSESTASELYGYLRNFRDHENLTGLWPLLTSNK
jgi:2-methylcitrate dehydratase PrpD